MPRYFILNSHYMPPPIIYKNNYSYIFVSREKEISVVENDKFILSSGENPKFEKKGIVVEKELLNTLLPSKSDQIKNDALRKKGLKILSPEIEWRLSVNFLGDLEKKQTYNNLVYSLLFVENYANPVAHIQQKIRLIPEFDFETIESGLIYLSRTAFGKLLNALPLDNRFEMRQILSDYKYRYKIEKTDYLQITEMLIKYIDEQFITQGKLLIESKKILDTRFPDNLEKFGLVDSNYDDVKKNIFSQANLFEPLLKTNIINILNELFDAVRKESITEDRFEGKFNSRRLPISLN
jgi:hypothetical protein